MTLLIRERLAMLLPPSWFYRKRIDHEARTGEPELPLLPGLIGTGGIAIDAGANQGLFAFALASIADRVYAFEPNPNYARFAKWMLRGRAEVHQLALANFCGRATFTVPLSDDGTILHYAGNIKQTHSQFKNRHTYEVAVRTLDSFGFSGVRFIKADVEGSERDVLDGARETIARDRPILLLELLSGTHDDPVSYTASICETFGYHAFVVQDGNKLPAIPTIVSLGKNTSWGTHISTRNVLFIPR